MAKDEGTHRLQKKEARATKNKLGALSRSKGDSLTEPPNELKNEFKSLLESEPKNEFKSLLESEPKNEFKSLLQSEPKNEFKNLLENEPKNEFKNLLENEPKNETKKDVFASISTGKIKSLEYSSKKDEADTLLLDNWGCDLEQSLTGGHSVDSLFPTEKSAPESLSQKQERVIDVRPEKSTSSATPTVTPLQRPNPQAVQAKSESLARPSVANQTPVSKPVAKPVVSQTAPISKPAPQAIANPPLVAKPAAKPVAAQTPVPQPALNQPPISKPVVQSVTSQTPVSKPASESVAPTQSVPVTEEAIPDTASEQTPESLAHLSEAALQVVAGNPRTSPSILCWLAAHYNPEIRSIVARNSNALPETVWLLAKDHDQAVRLALAEHLETNRDVLKALSNDPSPLVSWRAQNTLSLVADGRAPEEVYGESKARNRGKKQQLNQHEQTPDEVDFLLLLAQKTTTPGRRLTQLATNPNSGVRAAVAENGNTPLEALWILVKDSSADVKVKLADNYNCPLEIIEILANDGDKYVGWRARSVLSKLTGQTFSELAPDEEPSKTSSGFVHSQ